SPHWPRGVDRGVRIAAGRRSPGDPGAGPPEGPGSRVARGPCRPVRGLFERKRALAGAQLLDDRAVRPAVAVAVARQVLQGLGHLLQFRRLALQPLDMAQRDALDVGAGAVAIAP